MIYLCYVTIAEQDERGRFCTYTSQRFIRCDQFDRPFTTRASPSIELFLLVQLLVHGLPPLSPPDLVPDQRGIAHDETEEADDGEEPAISQGGDEGLANDGSNTCDRVHR